MTILHPPAYRTSALTWNRETRTWSAEQSDLGPFGAVYDDACDEGLTLVGETGREVVFVVEDTKLDAERDILWWVLEPANPRERALLRVKVRIYND